MVEQFKALFDPGTALGAFLISLLASAILSFFAGKKYGQNINLKQKNSHNSQGTQIGQQNNYGGNKNA